MLEFGQGLKYSVLLEITLSVRGLGVWINKLFKGKDMSRTGVNGVINNISLDSRTMSSSFSRVTFWSSIPRGVLSVILQAEVDAFLKSNM